MNTVLFKKWKVQADPENARKHPLHEHRYITTEDFDFADNHTNGSIICAMRDLERQKDVAGHIVAAHNTALSNHDVRIAVID